MLFPYGLWSSPISSEDISSSTIKFQELHCNHKAVYWTESRSYENGRHVLISYSPNGESKELLPPNINVKTRIHEYGGGAFYPYDSSLIYWDDTSKSLYVKNAQNDVLLLIHDIHKRFADFAMMPDQSGLCAVCEDHTKPQAVDNYLIYFDLKAFRYFTLHQEFDFYASPRISPSGNKIAFIGWNFPHMPWEESKLIIAKWSGTSLETLDIIGVPGESISYPVWQSDETVIFSSDRSGFSNLYSWDEKKKVTSLYEMDADFTSPLWTLGKSCFKPFLLSGQEAILCSYCQTGIDHLAILHLKKGDLEKLDLPFTSISSLDIIDNEHAFFIGAGPLIPSSVIHLNLSTYTYNVLSSSVHIAEKQKEYISLPKLISTSSSLDGKEIYGFYYPPKNPLFSSENNTLPPLIIRCHGGPTAHAQPILTLETQFWTSRGFAFLDTNYRGSSGHGKEYRDSLKKNWGVLDVSDCRDLAQHLVRGQAVDPHHLFIRGGSAGGYTALYSACTFSDYLACTSLYGVADLCLLAKETHKFEKHYLDSLIGPYPQDKQLYEERSPIFHCDQISCPILFLHGEEDPVVPVAQAQNMHHKLTERQISSELVVFPLEAHGFRQASSIKKALDTEYQFYLNAMGLSIHPTF